MYFNRRELLILNELLSLKYKTAAQLALTADASVRTIKSDIKNLRNKLDKEGIKIDSTENKGYKLYFETAEVKTNLYKYLSHININRLHLNKRNNYERIFYIIRRLLVNVGYIKLDDLAEEMFVSRSTLNVDMPEVKRILNSYQLSLISKANYGITIKGYELNKRTCIEEYFFQNNFSAENHNDPDIRFENYNRAFIPEIESVLKEVCDSFNVILSDFSLQNIAVYVLISIIRNKQNHPIDLHADNTKELNQDNSHVGKASQQFLEILNSKFNAELSDNEMLYISMHIETKQILQSKNMIKEANWPKIDQALEAVYFEIKNNFDIDLSNDFILKKYLALHVYQMLRRVRSGMVLRNPIVHENLQKYIFAAKVTISAVKVMEDYFNIKINLNEFGYLMLYFNVALRNLNKKSKISICMVSGRGRAETIMYLEELRDKFPQDKYVITNCDSVEDIIGRLGDYDIFISSYEMDIPEAIPQVAIEKGDYIKQIQQIANNIDFYRGDFSDYFNRYFQEAFSNFHLEGSDKESILQNILQDLKEQDIVESHSELEAPFVAHEIGNNIVHLQDLHKVCRKPVCYIAVLNDPIVWDNDVVRVLFLIKTKRDGDHHLNILCEMFSKWAQNKENIQRLVKRKNYKVFLDDILTMESSGY
ncbi:BglG family transcription antiterminator [Oceanobacillus neutriphilus]|uniref:PTS fructose transporter subunit IIA n=1 Tax=Oceanobacillus neutriphilus TaxID=531815 RepID=A0ABQ2NN09_9BACI|nr:PRD domain-containing protein [Oceanobacillus neutriphilus]GGP07469.1 PTS fructose transporter subunit IIA [Oceanobacillus neutriphilus]